jgi:hypothetical protein
LRWEFTILGMRSPKNAESKECCSKECCPRAEQQRHERLIKATAKQSKKNEQLQHVVSPDFPDEQ